jgi:hypothetical protein
LAHTTLGRDVLEQVRLTLGDNVIIEAPPKMEGKSMTMIIAPRPAKGAPRPVRTPSADGASPSPRPASAAVAPSTPVAEPVASAPAAPEEAQSPVAEPAGVTTSR